MEKRVIESFEDFKSVVLNKWLELSDLNPEYLSERGKAAMEAYRCVYWHISFHDSSLSLILDEEFKNLVNISGKHSEFYRVIRMINRTVDKINLV